MLMNCAHPSVIWLKMDCLRDGIYIFDYSEKRYVFITRLDAILTFVTKHAEYKG